MINYTGTNKIIVCGSREFNDYKFLKDKLNFYLKDLGKIEIVSGCAKGPDTLAIGYAEEYGYKLWRFPPDWKHFGNSAGMVRNKMMAEFSTHCIAFWDGKSTGTHNMIKVAQDMKLKVRLIKIDA